MISLALFVFLGTNIWSSPQECAQALQRRELEPRATKALRVASWNVRWFPDGKPGNERKEEGTDIQWMACILTALQVDVLGLQEIKLTQGGRDALMQLLTELKRKTGAKWSWEHDNCPTPHRQHL